MTIGATFEGIVRAGRGPNASANAAARIIGDEI